MAHLICGSNLLRFLITCYGYIIKGGIEYMLKYNRKINLQISCLYSASHEHNTTMCFPDIMILLPLFQ